jgi:hypothetical protein
MDGSAFASKNCVLATSTDLIDRTTVGRLRVLAPTLRKVSGDTSGGVSYEQAAAATSTATGGQVKLYPRYALNRTQVMDLSAAGVPFGISILCLVTRYTTRRTGTFTGGHTVYVQETRWVTSGCQCETAQKTTNHREYLVEDPGTSAGYLWWSEDLLCRAAEARGGGHINVLAGIDTEGLTRVCIGAGSIRATPNTSGTKRGTLKVGAPYTVTSTTNGGNWARDSDGGTANGWHRISTGYVRGEALR